MLFIPTNITVGPLQVFEAVSQHLLTLTVVGRLSARLQIKLFLLVPIGLIVSLLLYYLPFYNYEYCICDIYPQHLSR